MIFQESLRYLLNLGNEVLAMKLGLENIRTLLAALENPQNNYLKVQVAGTNGKGSVCVFLEAICVSAGIKVGLTTSPHLISITERIKINGREISEEDFARHATKVREISEQLVENSKLEDKSKIRLETVPTFFEQVTAIALNAFAEAKIDLAILETGLGGRFDATTGANAEIVAITPIDFDHQNILGNSLAHIAAEKAAVIRRNTKVVLAKQSKEASKIIQDVCANFSVAPKLADFAGDIVASKDGKFIINFQTRQTKYENVKLNLRGRHQIENAKVAILLAETLQNYFNITGKNIIKGLETAVHKGRLEFYNGYLFDGAHNIGGAKALREFLDEFVPEKITMVFGAMRDKDLNEISAILFPKADKLIFTKADNPRSIEPQNFLNFTSECKIGTVFTANNVTQAVKLARQITTKDDLILVTGSLYLVGEAQKILQSKNYV
ncbi:MAG: bifunctional folylpolyglutamate synthase/dihydrofolate synthase [Acidobacteriota bacterium]|nr:bifunctional folylpolyglutamate synthase/dihydrofolate synthase [Acidobacteriota bacterium]